MRARSHKYDDKKLFWLRAGKEFVLFLVVAILVFRFVVGVSRVSGESMEPTLKNGAPVVYFRLARHFERGQVVSVRFPSEDYYVKRVIAIAGDTVDIVDGQVLVNGVPEGDGYAHSFTETVIDSQEEEGLTYPLTVGEGQIFVLGDHREVSVDSRAFGPVSTSQVRGKLLFVH